MTSYKKTSGPCTQWGTYPSEMYPNHRAEGVGEITLVQYDPPRRVMFDICFRCASDNWGPASMMLFRDDEGNRVEWDPRFRWLAKPRPE